MTGVQDSRHLKLGVVGLGNAAAFMLPALLAHPHTAVAAAADPNEAARARFESDIGGRTYSSAEEMCAAGDIDAVYIATPHQRHVEDTLTAARHGKHVLVEKPMALTLEECDAMIAAAERHGVALMVGHTHAYNPVILAMRSVIESGELGRLRMITNLVYTNFLYRPRRPEELDTSRGGGIMYNQVPHHIEMARALDGGPIRSLRAVTGVWDDRRPTEGALSALIEFEDGVVATLAYSGYDHFDSDEFQFWVGELGEAKTPDTHGAARRALGSTRESEAKIRSGSGFSGRGAVRATGWHQPHFGMLLVSCEGGDMRAAPDGVLIYDDNGRRERPLPAARATPYRDSVIDELYDAVVHGRRPRHDGKWGRATVAATLALMQSARERREIVLAPGTTP